MSTAKFEIAGMHCNSCKMLIIDILQDEGVAITTFDVDLKKQLGTLVVDTNLPSDKVTALIKSAGDYSVKSK